MNASLRNTSELSLANNNIPVVRQRWALTQEAFDAFLNSLSEDREMAGERYLEIRNNLIKFFEWRGGPFPEEHADETINRIAKRVSEREDLRNPAGYYLGVARMILFEVKRERVRQDQTRQALPAATITPYPNESESQAACLRHCLQQLSADNRYLILHYYDGERREKIDSRKRLAHQLETCQDASNARADYKRTTSTFRRKL